MLEFAILKRHKQVEAWHLKRIFSKLTSRVLISHKNTLHIFRQLRFNAHEYTCSLGAAMLVSRASADRAYEQRSEFSVFRLSSSRLSFW